ncbi:MAG: thiol:disulfide interchange protein DsbA/DsbL, partial [Lachnospirales bacterium]
ERKMLIKKIIAALAFSAIALLGADFKEGINYKTLETPLDVEKNTIVKVWSYTCPFCYKYDKAVTEAVINKIPNIDFEVWHLKTKGTYGQQGSNLMAVAYARDIKAGKTIFDKSGFLKKMKFAYYKAYHTKKQRWDSGEDDFYKEGFKILSVDKAAFEKELAKPEVQELLKKWDAAYPVAKVQGIPGFVVNGKYLLMTQKIKSREYMVDLITYLLKK